MTRIVAPLVPTEDVSLWHIAKMRLPSSRKAWPVDVYGWSGDWRIASWYAVGGERMLPCEVLIDGRKFAASIQNEPLSLVLEAVDFPQLQAK